MSATGEYTALKIGLAVAGVLVATVGVVIRMLYGRPYRSAKLTVNAVSVSQPDFQSTPRIDVVFLNNSDEVVHVKEVAIQTKKYWEIPAVGAEPSYQNISRSYDVEVSKTKAETITTKISHRIKSQDTDRIEIHLGSDHVPPPAIGMFVYLLRIHFTYNVEKRVTLPLALVHIPPTIRIHGWAGIPLSSPEEAAAKHQLRLNEGAVKEISRYFRPPRSWLRKPIDPPAGFMDSLKTFEKRVPSSLSGSL